MNNMSVSSSSCDCEWCQCDHFAMPSEEHVFAVDFQVCEHSTLGDKVKSFTKCVRDTSDPYPHPHLACQLEMLTNGGKKAL